MKKFYALPVYVLLALVLMLSACATSSDDIDDDIVPPTEVSVSQVDNTMLVTWNAVTDSRLSGYYVYRATGNARMAIINDTMISISGELSYTDEEVTSNETYFYAVAAAEGVHTVGHLSEIYEVQFVYDELAIPSGLTATASGTAVELSWVSSTEDNLDGYNIYRSTVSGSGFSKLNTTLVNTQPYLDDTITLYQDYYYKITAVNTVNEETEASSEVSINVHITE